MGATDVPTGRALHLVDLENVLGDPWATGPAVVDAYEAVLDAGDHRTGDIVVVAVNPWMFDSLAYAPHTSCELLVGRGHDGCDLQLLGWESPEWIVQRFDRLAVASGDGIFAGLVDEVRDAGRAVDVVYGRGGVSRRLQRDDVRLLPVPMPVPVPLPPLVTDRVGDDHALAA